MARTYTTLDDMEHYQTTRLNPVCRRAFVALGRRLREQGILDRPEDIFFLRRPDVEALVGGAGAGRAEVYRRKVKAAKAEYEASGRRAPPWALDDSPPADGQAAPALRGLLHDDNARVRSAAGAALKRLAPDEGREAH